MGVELEEEDCFLDYYDQCVDGKCVNISERKY